MNESVAALVLAAGQGKRMASALTKVLHPCHQWPMVCHPIAAALAVGARPVVVVCAEHSYTAIRQVVEAQFVGQPVQFALQKQPRGTGDAAAAGLAALPAGIGRVLIVYGDTPLLQGPTLRPLLAATAGANPPAGAFVTAHMAQPRGYGRVVRNAEQAVVGIVEDRDATAEQARITEINAGVYCFDAAGLARWLGQLNHKNAQGELYLTDCVAQAVAAGGAVGLVAADADDIRGVNARHELQAAAAILQARVVRRHQDAGVSVQDPAGSFIGPEVVLGRDVELGMGVQLRGRCRLADGVRVEGPACIIDSEIGEGAWIRAFSHLEGAQVATGAQVGPMARLRPGACLGDGVRVGNFVEIKAAKLGDGAKVNHLSYVGNAHIEAGANLGAGTITCNYDGFHKHQTYVGAGAFIGSHSTLVAPVRIGAGAFVAAGSTITDTVAQDDLAFGRARQTTYAGGGRALRLRLQAEPVGKEKDKR